MGAFYKTGDFVIPGYMGEGIKNYIEHRLEPGNFLAAIICNDLKGAVFHADSTNLYNIPAYVMYFYWKAPAGCHGSREKMEAWLKGENKEGE